MIPYFEPRFHRMAVHSRQALFVGNGLGVEPGSREATTCVTDLWLRKRLNHSLTQSLTHF